MVRRPSLRRSDQEATQDDRTAPAFMHSEGRPAESGEPAEHSTKIEQAAERAAAATRTAAASAAADRAHARPRSSALASLSLVLAVVAVLAVATGALAGLGAAIGIIALVLSLAGLAATGHHYRYLAGRSEATIALLLSLAAIVVGVLAVVGVLSWLDTGTDQVARLQEWLPSWLS